MATRRYISKKSRAQFSYSIDSTILSSFDFGDGYDYVADGIFLVNPNTFTYKASSIMTTYYSGGNMVYQGEHIEFRPLTYTEASYEYNEEYDEETGEYGNGEYIYTVPAGSYFALMNPNMTSIFGCSYFTSSSAYSTYKSRYQGYTDIDYTNYCHRNGCFYATTDLVIHYEYTTDEDYNYYSSCYVYSGTMQLVKPSVTCSTSSYEYHSTNTLSTGVWWVNSFFESSSASSVWNKWQYYTDESNDSINVYAYCPLTYETMPSFDPSSVALSNTTPVVGSSNSIVVSGAASTLSYGVLTYLYQYSTNSGSTWTTLGSSSSSNYSFTIPKNISTIQVRIQASDGIGCTSSNYVTSANYTVSSYMIYTSVNGVIKGISPKAAVGGGYATLLLSLAKMVLSRICKYISQYIFSIHCYFSPKSILYLKY